MQGSFWKSIAVVGVIGIGSLAILEVQRSITDGADQQAQDDADAVALAEQIVHSGEQTVDATLGTSDFEKLLTGGDSSAPQFDLTEPADDAGAESPFYDAAAAQESTAVDTSVAAAHLSDGNPFAREEAAAVRAGYSSTEDAAGSKVQPVGFEQESESESESAFDILKQDQAARVAQGDAAGPSAEQPKAFAEDDAVAESSGNESLPDPSAEPFPLFGLDEPAQDAGANEAGSDSVNSNADPAETGTPAFDDPVRTPQPTDLRSDEMMFIGADEPKQDRANPSLSDDVSSADSSPSLRTAQNGDRSAMNLQPTPDLQASPFPEDAADSDPAASTGGRPATVPSFDEPFDSSFGSAGEQPESNRATERGNSQPNPPNSAGDSTQPFSEDLVPVPREPGQEPPAELMPQPDPQFGTPSPQPMPRGSNGPTFDDRPESTPAGDAAGSSALPFAEDMNPSTAPNRSNDPAAPGFDNQPFDNEPFKNEPPFGSEGNFDERGSGEPGFGGSNSNSGPPPLSIPGGMDLQPTPRTDPRFDRVPDRGNNLNDPLNERRNDSFDENGTGRSIVRPLRDDRVPSFPDRSGTDSRSPGNSRIPGDSGFNADADLTYPEVRPRPQRSNRDDALRTVAGVMRPNLVLQKSAPENATVGTPLKYSILVRNEGDATAYDVVVEDEVTPAAEVSGVYPQSEIDRQTNKLIWKFAKIEPGEDQTITVEVVPTGEGTMDGVATVRFKTQVKATTVVTAPRLEVQMRGPDEVRLGDEVKYSYVITNRGSGEARDVYVRTLLPEDGGLRHPAGNDLEYKIDSLKPNEQREISLAVIAGEPGEFRADAEVTATGGIKDQASWRTKIVGAQLRIVRRGPRKRFVNREGTFENIISNESNFDARDARVVEQVPAGMRFIDATRGGRYDSDTRTVTWNINHIGAGEMETLQVRLMPTTAGSAESTVTIYENVGLQSSEVSTTVVEDLHNVSADISQLDGPVAAGEVFGFTIAVDNRGTADATDVSLTVEVPDAIQVVGAGSREVQARLLEGNIVQYNVVVRIPPNQQKDFEIKLKGLREVQNALVKASVRYAQMEKPLVVSESVTIYESL